MTATEIAKRIIYCFDNGNKLLLAGNGGSSSQADHMAAEFVNKYTKYQTPHPAISLNNPAIITSIANDSNYAYVFSRQVEAFGKIGDLLITFSTSGNSRNLHYATGTAKTLGLETLEWPRKGSTTGEIQDYQLKLMHKVCEKVERYYDN